MLLKLRKATNALAFVTTELLIAILALPLSKDVGHFAQCADPHGLAQGFSYYTRNHKTIIFIKFYIKYFFRVYGGITRAKFFADRTPP